MKKPLSRKTLTAVANGHVPEPVRDPDPVHHAMALVERLDRHDLEVIGHLVLKRLQEIYK